MLGRLGGLLVQLTDQMDSLWTVEFLAIERFRVGEFWDGETRGRGEGRGARDVLHLPLFGGCRWAASLCMSFSWELLQVQQPSETVRKLTGLPRLRQQLTVSP